MSPTDQATRPPLTLADFEHDPWPLFARLREETPVVRIESAGLWMVLRYEDCCDILRDSDTFTTHSPESLILDTFGPQMLSLDGTEHRRHRRPFNADFALKTVRDRHTNEIQQRVDALIDGFSDRDAVELRTAFASPLAMGTVAAFLGFPYHKATELREWYDRFAAALSNFDHDAQVRDAGHAAAAKFHEAAAHTPEGIAGDTASGLSPDERLSNALLILFGGIETTESMILNALWALFTHPGQLTQLRQNPDLIPNAIQESLRWEAAVQSCTRHATRDLEFQGAHIRAGDVVQCMLGSANRDPARFENPDDFNIRRNDAEAHLTFGYGRHMCIGKHLALLEAEIALRTLLEHFPRIRFDADRSNAPIGYEFRKPAALWIHPHGSS